MTKSIFDALYEKLSKDIKTGAARIDYNFQRIDGDGFPYPGIYAVCLEPQGAVRKDSRQPVCMMSVDGCAKEITVLVDEQANLTKDDVGEEVNRLISQRTS
ncbi:hypothetical protein GF351_02465 [Candidatus Woesearchaeota archaeon]|nr:hypothetical protein [Candidatus Woesearchaeota archaeon]